MVTFLIKLNCAVGNHEFDEWYRTNQPGYRFFYQWERKCKCCNKIKVVVDDDDNYHIKNGKLCQKY